MIRDNVQLCQDLALFSEWEVSHEDLFSHKGDGSKELVTYAYLIANMEDLEEVLSSASLNALKSDEYLADNIRSLARGDFEKGKICITAFKGILALADFMAKYNITWASR